MDQQQQIDFHENIIQKKEEDVIDMDEIAKLENQFDLIQTKQGQKPIMNEEKEFDKIKAQQSQQEYSKYIDSLTPEEVEQEKKKVIEQIKDLEEDYYKPKEVMPDEEFDKIEEYLTNHPLFMKEIPEDISGNEHLQALSNIIYDDTAENNARYCQQRGNELFKKGQDKQYYMNKAFEAYTEGIESNSSEKEVTSKLYNNRALIQIKRKNYGKAIEDCKEAVKLMPQFVKAFYRCAQAYTYLMKYKEAIEMLEKAAKIDPKDKSIKDLLKQNKEKMEKIVLKEQAKKDKKSEEQNILFNALKIRDIYLGKNLVDFPDYVNKSCWLDEQGELHFPAFVSYPEFQQVDYIQDIHENHVFADHVKELFGEEGIPYDVRKSYKMDNIEIYIELNIIKPYYDIKNLKNWPSQKGLLKIDMYKKMAKLMATKGYVLPKVAEFYIVCPDNTEFYGHFKKHFDFIDYRNYQITLNKQ